MEKEPYKVNLTDAGSLSKSYHGHGTDKALLGGVQGFDPCDERIRDAFKHADESGLKYEFVIDEDGDGGHPNTADILLTAEDGIELFVRGWSIGGGKVKIVKIDNVDVEFTGEYSTLIVKQLDKPGVVAWLTNCLALQDVNIAFMRLFREAKGETAYTIIESDEKIPADVLAALGAHKHVLETTLIQI